MKILIVGVTGSPESTNYHQLEALKSLGHEAEGFDYRKIAEEELNRGDIERAGDRYKEHIEKFKPDTVLFSKFNNWPTNMIEWTNAQGIHTHYWYMDPMLQLTHDLVAHARACKTASCTGIAQTEFLKASGADCYHIFEGVNTNVYYPEFSGEYSFSHEVTFIGSRSSEREDLIQYLRELGVDISVFGPGWDNNVVVDAPMFRELCGRSKCILGFDREVLTYGYFSDRAFRVMACGGVYVGPQPPGTDKWLIDGENCFVTPELDRMYDKLVETLENKDRDHIRESAIQFIKENHTWEHSMTFLVDRVINCNE